MPAKIIDGIAVSRDIRKDLKVRVAAMSERGIIPGLAVIIVGNDPVSAVYVRNKIRACAEVGIHSLRYDFAADVSPQAVLDLIAQLNDRGDVNGTEQRAFAGNFLYSTGANEVAGRHTLGHFDLPFRHCTIELDGKAVVKDGKLAE